MPRAATTVKKSLPSWDEFISIEINEDYSKENKQKLPIQSSL